jgi:hypothetical protein
VGNQKKGNKMSLYQCSNCDKYYLHTKECGDYLTQEADKNDVSKAILVCQCGRKHLIGLESYDDGYCYFSEDLKHVEYLEKLKEFPVVILKETNKDNYICSTYTYNYLDMKGRTVYLDIDKEYLNKDQNYEKVRKIYNMVKGEKNE